MTPQEAKMTERERCANLVREALPICGCRFLKNYGQKCVRCTLIDRIEAKGTATR